jgi:hypothetical protein
MRLIEGASEKILLNIYTQYFDIPLTTLRYETYNDSR